MKPTIQSIFSIIAFVLFQSQLAAEKVAVETITQSQADAIIQARMEAKADKDAALRQKINAVSVIHETTIKHGDQHVIVRRVAAPRVVKNIKTEEFESKRAHPESAPFEFPVDPRKHETISVSATIFDDFYSKVVWRDSKTGQTFNLWTNINMVYLNPLSAFDTENAHYNYFAMTNRITRRGERETQEAAAKMGFEYESRWQPLPIKLSDETYEYVVVTETYEAVPKKLYEQMDAFFAFYLEERDSLETNYKNSLKLQIAHEKFMKENPPEVEPSIINFWPKKNSSYQSEQP